MCGLFISRYQRPVREVQAGGEDLLQEQGDLQEPEPRVERVLRPAHQGPGAGPPRQRESAAPCWADSGRAGHEARIRNTRFSVLDSLYSIW